MLLTITGSRIGRVAPVPERLNGAFISQHVAILRLKEGLLPEFLSMFLSLDSGGQRTSSKYNSPQSRANLHFLVEHRVRYGMLLVPNMLKTSRFAVVVRPPDGMAASA